MVNVICSLYLDWLVMRGLRVLLCGRIGSCVCVCVCVCPIVITKNKPISWMTNQIDVRTIWTLIHPHGLHDYSSRALEFTALPSFPAPWHLIAFRRKKLVPLSLLDSYYHQTCKDNGLRPFEIVPHLLLSSRMASWFWHQGTAETSRHTLIWGREGTLRAHQTTFIHNSHRVQHGI